MDKEIRNVEKILLDLLKLESEVTSFKARIEAGLPAELRVKTALRKLILVLSGFKDELEGVRVSIETELLDQDVNEGAYEIQIKEEKDNDEGEGPHSEGEDVEAGFFECSAMTEENECLYPIVQEKLSASVGSKRRVGKRCNMSPVVLLERIDDPIKKFRKEDQSRLDSLEHLQEVENIGDDKDYEYEPSDSNTDSEAEWENAEFYCSEQEEEEDEEFERDPLALPSEQEVSHRKDRYQNFRRKEKVKCRRVVKSSPETRERRRSRYEKRGIWKGPGTRLEWFVIPPSVKDDEGRIVCVADGCPWKGPRRQALVTHIKVAHVDLLEEKYYKVQTLVLKLLEDIPLIEESQLYTCIFPDCDFCFKARNKREVHRHMRREHPDFLMEKYNIEVLPGEDGYSAAVLKIRKTEDRNVLRLLADLEASFDMKSGRFQCPFPECTCGALVKAQVHRHLRLQHPDYLSEKYGIEVEGKRKGQMRKASCPICSITVLRKDLKAHLSSHDEQKQFVCELCGSRLKTKDNLRYHLKNSHRQEGEDDVYLCSECGAKLKTKAGLSTHMRRVHLLADHRPHKCHLCEFAFKQKSHLRDHLRTHAKQVVKAEKEDLELIDT